MSDRLAGVKVGDKIKVSGRFGAEFTLYTVERVTATQAVCDKARFRLDNGLQIGSRDRWYSSWGSIASEADIAGIELRKRIKSVGAAVSQIKVTADNLEAAEAFVAACQPKVTQG